MAFLLRSVLLTIGVLAVSVADTTRTERSANWLILPFASYSPTTKLAGGLVVGYYRPEREGKRASSLQSTITVTQRRQIIVGITPELYLNENQWRIFADLKGRHFPDSFYGIGGGTPEDAEEKYTARNLLADLTIQRRINPDLRIGPRVFLRGGTVDPDSSTGLLGRDVVAGANGGFVAGLGGTVFWDARDSRYYPTKGTYAETAFTVHSAALGSDFTFGKLEVDLRGYNALGPGVLAGQVYTETVMGTAPFDLLPLLGGSERLRGYREGRFRDNVYWTAQTEYRFPLFWRLKGAAFTSVGEVAPRIGGELFQNVEAAIGLGGRLKFTEDGVHGRLDVAYSRTGIELYVSLGEAF